ncbi:RHS repeat-associated core domain-containing protein [Clostridium sartagoforme]|uniref:RHS repeat-associated core domain-containing protein n=1 Tax=Clostridium sartagoforme TaxID=84031 RepID=UPI0031DC583C
MNIASGNNPSINGEYFYIRNIQGDIIGLIDKSGTEVASYSYDTWGQLISIEGSLKDTVGVKNPYRYRGYRYDIETELYYLNARYYNAEWGRFINADTFLGIDGMLLSHNLFSYCMNNPVNHTDSSGYFLDIIADIISAAISIINVIKNPSSGKAWLALGADVTCAILPFATGGGAAVRAATKVDDVVDTVKAVDKGSDVVKGVVKTADNIKPYTKSSLKMGQNMHKAYKADVVDNIIKFKEYRLPSGRRIDFIDFGTKTIYELKPYNPRQIKAGTKQLEGYLKEVESIFGRGWSTVLDTY